MIAAPYGTWPSPITPALLTERAVGLSQVGVLGDRVVWNEARPSEAGRQVLVAARPGEPGEDLTPAGFSARTQVHEYGGRCWTVAGDAVVASNWDDQRLWRFAPGAPPEPLTEEPPQPRAFRYADPVATPDGRWVIAVRERHHDGAVDNDLVAVALDRPATVVVLADGHDFFSAPALSPDGRRLAWLSWDHPNMPWDDTELWAADLDADAHLSAPRRVAGSAGESVQQPRWSGSGVLHWVSDRSGWWNLYADGAPLCPADAEFGEPGWVFGTSTYTFTSDGRLIAAWSGPDGSGIGEVRDGKVDAWDLPYAGYSDLRAFGDGVVCLAASPTSPPAVIRIDRAGRHQVLRASRVVDVDPAFLSRPERLTFPTSGGERAWALVYRPASATHEGPPAERPPLVVMSHGGPTSAASSSLNLGVQYWTSRGFAVADVDYRGSTGYGREYRNRLRGDWGVCDVEDCAAVARWLGEQGSVDPARCVIRGGSAGGFTTLAALAFSDVFAAGASLYGVADLAALARDTHKFESRYLDRMVGPWPEAEAVYRARSPIHHVEGFDRPLILFQGLEDMVVPPAQSEIIYHALRDKGIPVAYLAFEGEQHGFRKAETIQAVAAAELSFYGRVLGFEPVGRVDVEIDNLP
ncbi:S9 family peptidase [Acidiferrimicrobium sp. IK]|uniref:S9 family peptidase n=1 Tax=Acidiferrimicrobium sp. IK TaxID=2871700 RepID=UPI0021CB14E7|nr:S9 family peptidase [Acidiferrimicrobium sp. IK]MCU4182788.1 S9 family peptidase [Acidiferrimicrobium sp. IK]